MQLPIASTLSPVHSRLIGRSSRTRRATPPAVTPTPTPSAAQPIGRVVESLGRYADPGMEVEIALRKHELPFEFSPESKAQARRLPREVRKKDV